MGKELKSIKKPIGNLLENEKVSVGWGGKEA